MTIKMCISNWSGLAQITLKNIYCVELSCIKSTSLKKKVRKRSWKTFTVKIMYKNHFYIFFFNNSIKSVRIARWFLKNKKLIEIILKRCFVWVMSLRHIRPFSSEMAVSYHNWIVSFPFTIFCSTQRQFWLFFFLN